MHQRVPTAQEQTIHYYNKYAGTFYKNTEGLDFSNMQNKFLSYLSTGDCILDFGCGVGRDAKYFLDHGIRVDLVDASHLMCRIAKEKTGEIPQCVTFQSFSAKKTYDGVWACASLLHLTEEDLIEVLAKMSKAIKNYGFCYLSFKYGVFEGIRDERFFIDMTEKRLNEILEKVNAFSIVEMFTTTDVRLNRNQCWLNAFLQKREGTGCEHKEMGEV